MSDLGYKLGTFVGAAVVGVPIVWVMMKDSIDRKRTIRALRAKPPIDAASGVGAQVFAIGSVRAVGELVVGPLSAKPCIAHRSRVYMGTFDTVPKKGERIGITTTFALERKDGSIVTIESQHARLVLPALALPPGSEERTRNFATACGVAKRYQKGARYEEVLVLEGMRVAVAGKLATAPEGGEPARLVGDAATPIIIGVPF